MKREDDAIAALDVGTSKVTAIIGDVFADGSVQVYSAASRPTRGLNHKGEITNLAEISDTIQKVLDDVARDADCEIRSVHVGISGAHIHAINEKGTVLVSSNGVTEQNINDACENARHVKLPPELCALQAVKQTFKVDDQKDIADPLGLKGVRLTSYMHLISCQKNAYANLKKAAESCKNIKGATIKAESFCYSGFASAEGVLTDDEKQLGVCLVDFGAGNLDITIYLNSKLYLSKTINYAGNNVTLDICEWARTPFSEAEQAKIHHGSAIWEENLTDTIELSTTVPGQCQTHYLSELQYVTTARYHQLLNEVKKVITELQTDLSEAGIFANKLLGGIVLTGGSTHINGFLKCAEIVFGKGKVRIGYPQRITGITDKVLSPSYATVIGLVRAQLNKGETHLSFEDEQQKTFLNKFNKKWKKFKDWSKRTF